MESVISFIMYESYYWLYLELWINFVSASIKGQPLYKGQKALSQCVRYSEVPLYLQLCVVIAHRHLFNVLRASESLLY